MKKHPICEHVYEASFVDEEMEDVRILSNWLPASP